MAKDKDDNKIQYIQLPRDLPKKGDDKVFFVSLANNEQIQWSWNEGSDKNFAQLVKWQTPHIRRYETDLDPIQSLFSFCPTQVLTYLFNSTQQESATRENVAAIMKSRYPVSVYVLSGVNSDDNDQTPEQKKMMQKREEGLEYLFQEYPSRLFKFRTVDFFKPEQNVSSSMTIDKVAELYGAFKLFGGPVLLLHTGHTIWYGALDATGNLLGEGISPGLGIRFQSLNDYCGPEFPMIEHQEFVDAISQASKDRKPLPMFGTDVKTSMIANISSELYGQLRNIVKQFESKVLYDVDPQNGSAVVTKEDVNVVITGRDGLIVKKLLNEGPDIVDVEQGVKSPKTKPSTYIVRRSMWTTAMQMLLSEHVGSEKPIDPDDEIRDAILGLRVAKAEIVSTGITSSQDVVRGTVVRISKGNQLEHDLYKILYDNAIQTWVDQVDLYDGLRLYMDYGEEKADEDTTWAKKKRNEAQHAQQRLEEKSVTAKERGKELNEAVEKGKTVVQVIASETPEPPTKKPRTSTPTNFGQVENPTQYVDRRIAKYFPVEESPDPELYFGTIDYYSGVVKGKQLWHVQYDDDDQEEFEYNQVRHAITLYAKHKDEDEKFKPRK